MAYNDDSNKSGNEDRKMYKVECSQCKQETEVPFEPDGVRPVYCKECYRKNKNQGRDYRN